jgi:hypothetical protein
MSPNVCVPSTTTYVEFVNDLMTALLPTNVVGTGVAEAIRFFKQWITPISTAHNVIKQMRHPYPPCPTHTPHLTQTFSPYPFDKNKQNSASKEKFLSLDDWHVIKNLFFHKHFTYTVTLIPLVKLAISFV